MEFRASSTNAFAGTDSASRYALVLQYCESHPSELLIKAVVNVVSRYRNDFPPPDEIA
jgi:hypothetical protein